MFPSHPLLRLDAFGLDDFSGRFHVAAEALHGFAGGEEHQGGEGQGQAGHGALRWFGLLW